MSVSVKTSWKKIDLIVRKEQRSESLIKNKLQAEIERDNLEQTAPKPDISLMRQPIIRYSWTLGIKSMPALLVLKRRRNLKKWPEDTWFTCLINLWSGEAILHALSPEQNTYHKLNTSLL
ncbi:hypothetical protein PoB_005868600 [Plakobranchus ocellatus]|uniref:Uncharacterized protein n=1 Tax=Plakobranchus ocellatus TaxID=259542 RepID=A0AAV4CH73_9GAST|nr:hypothetical protein PoB_005868600 [Plakobranchus ocellatus]